MSQGEVGGEFEKRFRGKSSSEGRGGGLEGIREGHGRTVKQWRNPVRAWIASKSFVSLNLAFTVRKKKGDWSTKKTPPYQPPEAAVRG